MRRSRAVITVFFSLLSVIFLAFSFAVIEAVRVSGARAACANAASLGCWSVFSEYENVLLEDYSLFAVDASGGSGAFSKDALSTRLRSYTEENTNAAGDMSGKLPGLTLDPWKMTLTDAEIRQYALLTDRGGEYYYQQAVAYMRQTAWANALGKLEEIYSDSGKVKEAESELELEKNASEKEMQEVNREVRSSKSELSQTDASGDGSIVIIATGEEAEQIRREAEEAEKKNPLEKIDSLRRRDLLDLVCGKNNISLKVVNSSSLYSKRKANHGTLTLDTPYGGRIDDLLFNEYLLDHFRNYADRFDSTVLKYQVEYLIGGKTSDKANLKTVARNLTAMREGFNYTFLLTDRNSNLKAQALAAAILGWTGKPLLMQGLKHALLLAWAYGESLFDVRILLHGGRIPLIKTAGSWNVPLENLIDLETDIKRADRVAAGGTTGLSYEDYLRLLIAAQSQSRLRKRSLDLIELNVRSDTGGGLPDFRIDNCIIGIKFRTDWKIPNVFGRIPQAFLGAGLTSAASGYSVNIEGGFAYK